MKLEIQYFGWPPFMPSFIKVSEMLQKSQQGDKCHTDNMVI